MNKCFILFFFLYSLSSLSAVRQSGKIMGKGNQPIVITLNSPKSGWTQSRMVEVEGNVSDQTIDPITVIINGDRYLLRTSSGNFKRKFPVTSGKNAIIVQGTNKAGTFKTERSLYAQVSPVSLVTILTSDTDGVYTDLHVYEPDPSAKDPFIEPSVHVFWANTNSPSGGVFYLNQQGDSYDQPGYGPYLYTHTSPPLGYFRIDSNYWPSGDKGHTVGTLNITLFGGTPQEVRRMIKTPLAKPGETITMAWIKVEQGQKVSIYSPGVDEKPKDNSVWPSWLLDFIPKASQSGEFGESD